jgi:outer membrane protein TolC
MHRMTRKVTTIRRAPFPAACLAFALAACVLSAGCSRLYFLRTADQHTYAIIEAKTPLVPGMIHDFSIEDGNVDVLEGCPVRDATIVAIDLGLTPAAGSAEAAADEEGAEQARTEAGPPPQVYVLTLSKALEIASTNSRDYQNQKETLYRIALSLTLARHAFEPRFFGSADGDYEDTDTGDTREVSADTLFGFSWLFATGAEISASLASHFSHFITGGGGDTSSSVFALSITQPLLEGAGISVTEPLTQAERDVIYAIRDFVQFRRQFFVDILSDYYGVLRDAQVVVNERFNRDSLLLAKNITVEEGKAGRRSGTEVDQVRQSYLQAEDRLVRSMQSYENSLDRFKIRLGLPTETLIELDTEELDRLHEEGVRIIDLPVDRLVEIALTNRLDLMTACDERDDAARKVEVAANDLLPGLDLHAGLEVPTRGANNPVAFSGEMTDFHAGFELDLPLDKVSERNEYRRRLIDLARANRSYTEQRDEVVREVRDDSREFDRTGRSYEIQKASVGLAERRVESTGLELQAGRAEARDLLDAQSDLVNSQNSLASALVDYKVSILRLSRDLDILVVGPAGELKENFDAYGAERAPNEPGAGK